MSNKVIGPDTWGPVIWHALHYITLGYPDNPTYDQKEKYKHFFTLLSDVLPCSICANHFSENLISMPLDENVLQNKESLIKWLIDFHNVVNEKNNKPIIVYEEARKLIEIDKECKHKIIIETIPTPTPIQKQTSIPTATPIITAIPINTSKQTSVPISTTTPKQIQVKQQKNLFNINNIYYLFGLLLFIIVISLMFKND